MKPHVFFRALTVAFLILVIAIAVLYYRNIIEDKWFAVLSTVLAVGATASASLMGRPTSAPDLAVVADKLLTTYELDTMIKLKEARQQEAAIRDFIEHQSDQVFYQKLHGYLRDELERKYENSEIAGIVEELRSVEARLDTLHVQYDSAQIPERFKRLLDDLDSKRSLSLLLEMVDALPFFPFKKAAKVYLKFRYAKAGGRWLPGLPGGGNPREGT